jgi:hypothetical protein
VLLIALWVRSYWTVSNIQIGNIAGHNFQLVLGTGHICFRLEDSLADNGSDHPRFATAFDNLDRTSPSFASFSGEGWSSSVGLTLNERERNDIKIVFSHWFASVFLVLLSAAPWLSWRYTLRTLLIATTLVAVVLGIIVWAAH